MSWHSVLNEKCTRSEVTFGFFVYVELSVEFDVSIIVNARYALQIDVLLMN